MFFISEEMIKYNLNDFGGLLIPNDLKMTQKCCSVHCVKYENGGDEYFLTFTFTFSFIGNVF